MMRVVKVPFSKGSMGANPGAGSAPDIVLGHVEKFLINESGRVPRLDVVALDIDEYDPDSIFSSIERNVSFSDRTCLLGGDHSITYSGFKAFLKNNPGAGIVILDAHPDCEHGTDTPSHEDFLRKLVSEGLVRKDRVILFGIRNWSGNEKEFLDTNNILYYTMKRVLIDGIDNVLDGITETVRDWPAAYLSIDIDVADPAFAPGTGYPEPGGLSSRELIYVVQRLALLKNLKGADVVEVGPDKDIDDSTSKLAAKILVELF